MVIQLTSRTSGFLTAAIQFGILVLSSYQYYDILTPADTTQTYALRDVGSTAEISTSLINHRRGASIIPLARVVTPSQMHILVDELPSIGPVGRRVTTRQLTQLQELSSGGFELGAWLKCGAGSICCTGSASNSTLLPLFLHPR